MRRLLFSALLLCCLFSLPAFAQEDGVDLAPPVAQPPASQDQPSATVQPNVSVAPSQTPAQQPDASPSDPPAYGQGPSQPTYGPPTTTEGPLTTTDVKTTIQHFGFDTMYVVSPYAVAAQHKLVDLNKHNVLYGSLRHRFMQGDRANDLQMGFAPKGTASSKLCVRNDALIDRYCNNQIVFLLVDTPINLAVKSEFVTQVREILKEYLQCPQSCQTTPVLCVRRVRIPAAVGSAQGQIQQLYEDGVIHFNFGFVGTNPSNTNVSQSNCNTSKNDINNGNNIGIVDNNVNNLSNANASNP